MNAFSRKDRPLRVSVENMPLNPGTTRSRDTKGHGFSIIELLVVVAIIMIISAMAILQLPTALRNSRSDTAMRQVVDQMRQAREYAIANRRYIQISFATVAGLAQITITQKNSLTAGAGPDKVLSVVPIQSPMQFTVFAAKGDTPDGYGNAAAIEFAGLNGGPPAGMYFQSDGELVAAVTYLPINGTVFVGATGDASTARAVTVLGTTGRVRGWNGTGATWNQF
jgi:prepilin-type N-terminal cleavage/methylation domain-containing protein